MTTQPDTIFPAMRNTTLAAVTEEQRELLQAASIPYPVLHAGPTSAAVIRDIFALHKGEAPCTVLDMTWGRGVFWQWDYAACGIDLYKNDLYVEGHDVLQIDFTDMRAGGIGDRSFDWVVFDPPFTANGPQSDGQARHQDRYRSTRDQEGAPQNVHDVRRLLVEGTLEAMRIARYGVVVKTQDVIESGRLNLHAALVQWLLDERLAGATGAAEWEGENAALYGGWRVEDWVMLLGARRAQPDKARGTAPQHFRERPSVFIVGRRSGR